MFARCCCYFTTAVNRDNYLSVVRARVSAVVTANPFVRVQHDVLSTLARGTFGFSPSSYLTAAGGWKKKARLLTSNETRWPHVVRSRRSCGEARRWAFFQLSRESRVQLLARGTIGIIGSSAREDVRRGRVWFSFPRFLSCASSYPADDDDDDAAAENQLKTTRDLCPSTVVVRR